MVSLSFWGYPNPATVSGELTAAAHAIILKPVNSASHQSTPGNVLGESRHATLASRWLD
jgi:hypothetical protein